MYFIARNNALYNYIAHTSTLRRYVVTFAVMSLFFVGGLYLIYYPLMSSIAVYKAEQIMLQKKYDELMLMKKKSDELLKSIDEHKKNIDTYALSMDKYDDHCHTKMVFILDTIAQLGLKLNSYGSCKEKDKKWYLKNVAHFEIVGPLEKIMSFLEIVKNSCNMITISHATMTIADDAFCQMSCDVGLVAVKK